MKHGNDGGMAPSYNVQISVDGEQKIIVGIELTQCSSDSGSLQPAMEQVKETMGRYPDQVVHSWQRKSSVAPMRVASFGGCRAR